MPDFTCLPIEIVYLVIEFIDDPDTFYCFSQVSKSITSICRLLTQKKMLEFSKEQRYFAKDRKHYYEYCVLPNGQKIGEHKIWLLDNSSPPPDNKILISHYFVNDSGSEVKAFWTTGVANVYQEWYHSPVNKIMTEYKIFNQSGELEVYRYNVPFLKSMFRTNVPI